MNVERQKSSAPQAEEKVTQLHARCNDFWRYLEPTQYARDAVHLSPELELDAHGLLQAVEAWVHQYHFN